MKLEAVQHVAYYNRQQISLNPGEARMNSRREQLKFLLCPQIQTNLRAHSAYTACRSWSWNTTQSVSRRRQCEHKALAFPSEKRATDLIVFPPPSPLFPHVYPLCWCVSAIVKLVCFLKTKSICGYIYFILKKKEYLNIYDSIFQDSKIYVI